jgi:hypothetical protein
MLDRIIITVFIFSSAIYRVYIFILYLSNAKNYINKILRDIDEVDIKKNGFTELRRLIRLKTGG